MVDDKTVFRKTAINTVLVFACLIVSSVAVVVPGDRAAFLVSAASIRVAGYASMAAVAWPLYAQYLNGDLDGDYEPHSVHDLLVAGREWVGDQYTRG
jgi:hypothetical protein